MRVDRPRVIRRGEIENAIQHERRGLDLQTAETGFAAGHRRHIRTQAADRCPETRPGRSPVYPRQRHLPDVELVDLPERAEAAARVIAVISGPCIGGCFEQLRRIQNWVVTGLLTRQYDRYQDCN